MNFLILTLKIFDFEERNEIILRLKVYERAYSATNFDKIFIC